MSERILLDAPCWNDRVRQGADVVVSRVASLDELSEVAMRWAGRRPRIITPGREDRRFLLLVRMLADEYGLTEEAGDWSVAIDERNPPYPGG